MSITTKDWQHKLELLIEKFGTADIRLDYPSMTLDEKRALFFRLIKHETE